MDTDLQAVVAEFCVKTQRVKVKKAWRETKAPLAVQSDSDGDKWPAAAACRGWRSCAKVERDRCAACL